MTSWKRDVASGLVVLVPIIVTVYVIVWLYNIIANVPYLERVIGPELFGGNVLAAEFFRVIITLLVFAAMVVTVGYLMRTALGRIIENALDDVVNHVPGLRVVYNASKMAVETALSGGSEFQTPVKIEPWDGMRMTAFKTGKRTADGREILFLPTAPNITSGYVVEVDSADVQETDETVEDALTRILSAGFGDNGERGVSIDVIEAQTGSRSGESGDAVDDD